MKDVILKIFSYNGEFNRKEYLLFGFLTPIFLTPIFFLVIVSGLSNFIRPIIGESSSIISVIFVYSILGSIVVSSTLKRARATASNTSIIMIIWILLTPIAVLYLMFSPNSEKKGITLFIRIIFGIIVLSILIILAAVAIPKLAESKQITQIEKEQASYNKI